MKHKTIIRAVYEIRNIVNNKVYIGSTANVKSRWANHINELNAQRHTNNYFQNAWNKYGEKNFVFEILEWVASTDNLTDREQHWINDTKSHKREFGYNICPASDSVLGIKRTPETKAKMSAWQIGRKMSDEAKAKMSKAKKGHVKSLETRAKLSIAGKNRRHSAETRAKMAISRRKRTAREEFISAIRFQ